VRVSFLPLIAAFALGGCASESFSPETAPEYVVVAEFRAKPDQVNAFRAYMAKHAALSRDEPGCRLFEVAEDVAEPTHFLLYELYDDETAYVAHRATAHYARFRAAAPAMLEAFDGELFKRRSVFTRCP
jgi:quinol monooxygenase YgiN